MTFRILKNGLLAVALLTGGAALAQSPAPGATSGGGVGGGTAGMNENGGGVGTPAGNGSKMQPMTHAESSQMQQKKTNPQKNGISESESSGGENKNGQMK